MRFFCDPLPNLGETAVLSDEIAKHARVLRLRVGDTIELFCEGLARHAVIERFERELEVRVLHAEVEALSEAASVTLVQALPKAKKIDTIVRMATEIGVDCIRLATSERTVPEWTGRRRDEKLARLQRIAQEAARQSNQRRVAQIFAPRPIGEIGQAAPAGATRFLFWEASSEPLPATLPSQETWVAIGPEGGWSASEAHILRDCGWVDASLPTGILRVQTAAPVALGIIRDRLARATTD